MKPSQNSLFKKETTITTHLAVRPFRINVPKEALVDLRRRLAATRWPDRETVTDQSQGVPLAKLQELVRCWETDYDFDLVLPSMPGYGFSGQPQGTGWGSDRIARAWAELMEHLGYKRFVSQGGDWGSVVSDVMARQAPAGLLGIHVNMPATVLEDVATALKNG